MRVVMAEQNREKTAADREQKAAADKAQKATADKAQNAVKQEKKINGREQKQRNSKEQKRKRRKQKKAVIVLLLIVLAAGGAGWAYVQHQKSVQASAQVSEHRTAMVTRRDITSELSSSGTLAPKDTYSITSLVEGEIIFAEFEEGDQVEKGQVLYQIDGSSMETEIQSANNSLTRAQKTYSSAVKDYQSIQAELSGNTYKATKAGYIKELHLEEGDKIGANAQICDIYDDLVMEIRIPFLSGEAEVIEEGMEAFLTLTDTGEAVSGVVTSVSAMEEVLAGGSLVRYVSIDAANPGGLTAQTSATAMVNGMLCAEEGSFSPKINTVMAADLESSVEVETILVQEGQYIEKGTPIFQITAESVEKILKNYEDSIDRAKESMESAENKVESTKDSYENYTITAPISGQVITKTSKLGDNISRNTNNSTVMAVIYDLSALTFEMSIDELDIQKVKVGQKVVVTADAFEGETFSGTVTNVSLQSTASNGVTNYPVTVTMDETGNLLPGMNVDGVIILEEVQDVLSIPVDSLMRGNRVYVKGEAPASGDTGNGDRPEGSRPQAGNGEKPEGDGPQAGSGEKPEGDGSQAGSGERPEVSRPQAESSEKPESGGPQAENNKDTNKDTERNHSSSERDSTGGAPEGFYAVEVETGLISDEYVEILSRLEEGQEVYVDESSQNNTNMFMMPGGMGGPGMGGPGGGMGGRSGSGGMR